MLKFLSHLIPDFGNGSRYRFGIGLVVLLSTMVAVERAHASCGDYLVIGGGDHTMDQSGNQTSHATPTPVGNPCHGPQCGRSPSTPLPPLPAQTAPSQDQRALVRQLGDFNLPRSFWYPVVEASTRLTPGFPFRLERPPRD